MAGETDGGRHEPGPGEKGARPKGGRSRYWTRERLEVEAAKWPTRSQWSKGHPSSFTAAKEQNFLDELKPALSGDALAAFQAERLAGGAPTKTYRPRAGATGREALAARGGSSKITSEAKGGAEVLEYRGVRLERVARRPGAEANWEARRDGGFVATAHELDWVKRAVDLWIAARPGERAPKR